MHDPWLKGHKVTFCFFAAGCIALAATGLVTLPRPERMTADLATRLEVASAFASSLLTASDGLAGAADNVRPFVAEAASVLQTQMGAAHSVEADVQCASTFADSALSGPSSPDAIQHQLDAAVSALRDGLAPAMAAAAALLATTYSTNGTTAALATVAAMPAGLQVIRSALYNYDTALRVLPSSRLPLSSSDPAVNSLRDAQAALNLTGWISSLDTLHDSLVAMAAAAQQHPYTQLATALRSQQASASNASQLLAGLTTSADSLDTLYLGSLTERQLQTEGAQGAGRACLGRLAERLVMFDTQVFRFNRTAERTAINAVYDIRASLDVLYGVNTSNSSAGATGTGAAATAETTLPVPLADGVSGLGQLVAALSTTNVSAVVAGCAAAQAALNYPNGSSALPDASPTLSYIQTLRTALAALQTPAAGVAAALGSYNAAASDGSYASLYGAANSTRTPYSSAALSAAAAPSPSGASALVAAAANSSANAGSPNITTTLQSLGQSMAAVAASLGNGAPTPSSSSSSTSSWAEYTNRVNTALTQLQAIFNRLIQQQQQQQQTGNSTAHGTIVVSASNSSAAAAALSAFLQPLEASVELIVATLSNGVAAVLEQLDNALGKSLTSDSSPPPSQPLSPSTPPSRRRLRGETPGGSLTDGGEAVTPLYSSGSGNGARILLAPSSSSITSATGTIRQQLVNRVEDVASMLRRDSAVRYSRLGYWVPVAVYGAVILMTLLLGVVVFANFPAGLVVCVLLYLFLAGLVLLGAWAVAAGTVVTHDACGNADGMVLGAVAPSSPLFPLVRYYLQGVGGSLPAVLRSTGLGDTVRLRAAANIVFDQILDPLLLPTPPPTHTSTATANTTDAAPWPGSLGTVQYVLGGVLVDLGAIATNVSSNLDTLLRLGDRSAVIAQYTSVTSWACCGLGGKLMMVWICATGCGVLAWLAALSAVMVLKNLDDMPVGRACGCSCYNPKDYPKPQSRRRRGYDRAAMSSSGGGAPSTAGTSSGGGAGPLGVLLGGKAGGPPAHAQAYINADGRACGSGGGGMPYRYDGLSAGGSSTISGGGSYGGYGGAGTSSGGASYAPSSGVHWPTGKRRSTSGGGPGKPGSQGKEVVVESGLYQGPPPPPPPLQQQQEHQGGPAAAYGPGGGSPGGGRASVSVCVMDPETAASYGYGAAGRDAGAQQGATLPYPSAEGPSAPPLPQPYPNR